MNEEKSIASGEQGSLNNNNPDIDDDLDALLDSALEDFDKPLPKKPSVDPENKEKEQAVASASSSNKSDCRKELPVDDKNNEFTWGQEFKQFQDAMQSFLSNDPQLKDELQQLAESVNKATAATSDEEFSASLAETLKNLADNTQMLNNPPSQEDIARLLGSLDLGEGAMGDNSASSDSGPDILPLMQNVLQNLLSKDLMYPALRDIVDKYPDWLAEKRPTLDQQKYENYNKQYELMKQLCEEFENESSDDSEIVKKARFEKVLVLMQKMQDCGNPPKDLIGEIGPDLQFDDQGNIKIPDFKSGQCAVM